MDLLVGLEVLWRIITWGLTANEFFFHTMGGREDLIDTTVKLTAETGTGRGIFASFYLFISHFDFLFNIVRTCNYSINDQEGAI